MLAVVAHASSWRPATALSMLICIARTFVVDPLSCKIVVMSICLRSVLHLYSMPGIVCTYVRVNISVMRLASICHIRTFHLIFRVGREVLGLFLKST
jgi:hypothetical protein